MEQLYLEDLRVGQRLTSETYGIRAQRTERGDERVGKGIIRPRSGLATRIERRELRGCMKSAPHWRWR
jgi:hypothetical protein